MSHHRHWTDKLRHLLLTLVLVAGLISAPVVVIIAAAGQAVASTTVGGNDYPWSAATDCLATYGEYSWCENGNDISPLGFGYRNCTDYVAYELNEQLGGTVSSPKFSFGVFGFNSSDGNADGWKTAITNHLGASAANNTPAIGSVDWYDSSWGGGFGHVVLIASLRHVHDQQ